MFVGGNEGLAEVTGVGDGAQNLERGDWVTVRHEGEPGWHLEKRCKFEGGSAVEGAEAPRDCRR